MRSNSWALGMTLEPHLKQRALHSSAHFFCIFPRVAKEIRPQLLTMTFEIFHLWSHTLWKLHLLVLCTHKCLWARQIPLLISSHSRTPNNLLVEITFVFIFTFLRESERASKEWLRERESAKQAPHPAGAWCGVRTHDTEIMSWAESRVRAQPTEPTSCREIILILKSQHTAPWLSYLPWTSG